VNFKLCGWYYSILFGLTDFCGCFFAIFVKYFFILKTSLTASSLLQILYLSIFPGFHWIRNNTVYFAARGTSENTDISKIFLEIDRNAQAIFWYLCPVPNIPRIFDIGTIKNIIFENEYKNILNNTKTKIVIPLSIYKDRTKSD